MGKITILLIGLVIITLYLLYGMLFKDFAGKHYDLLKKYFPAFIVWPKKRERYVVLYKIVIVVILFGLISLFFYSAINR
jgi:hypothetical protein